MHREIQDIVREDFQKDKFIIFNFQQDTIYLIYFLNEFYLLYFSTNQQADVVFLKLSYQIGSK